MRPFLWHYLQNLSRIQYHSHNCRARAWLSGVTNNTTRPDNLIEISSRNNITEKKGGRAWGSVSHSHVRKKLSDIYWFLQRKRDLALRSNRRQMDSDCWHYAFDLEMVIKYTQRYLCCLSWIPSQFKNNLELKAVSSCLFTQCHCGELCQGSGERCWAFDTVFWLLPWGPSVNFQKSLLTLSFPSQKSASNKVSKTHVFGRSPSLYVEKHLSCSFDTVPSGRIRGPSCWPGAGHIG